MSVKLYYTSVSSNMQLKTKQTRIENVLESKGIQFELIDISAGDDDTKAAVREEMRKGPGPTAMPPQLYNGTEYCGDYDAFDNAVEEGALNTFLKLS